MTQIIITIGLAVLCVVCTVIVAKDIKAIADDLTSKPTDLKQYWYRL